MGTVHSGKISHLTWTFTKKYWAVLGCTGLYWAVLGHLRYLLGNVQIKWRILPLCIAEELVRSQNLHNFSPCRLKKAEAGCRVEVRRVAPWAVCRAAVRGAECGWWRGCGHCGRARQLRH